MAYDNKTIEGVRVQTTLEAMQPGEGFSVRVDTAWDQSLQPNMRGPVQTAQSEGILGNILNGHSDTYGGAEAKISGSVNQFEQDFLNFLSTWNASGSAGFQDSGSV